MRSFPLTVLFLLLAICPTAADEIDEGANAAAAREWLSAAARPFAAGEHAGLPLYSAHVMEELPSREEYLERGNWCSYYCCAPEIRISASSMLEGTDSLHYDAEMAWDYDLATAWVEGAADPGGGEWISFEFITDGENPDGAPFADQYVNGLEIVNGYSKSAALHAANGCPTLLRLWFNGEAVCCIELQDTRDIQEVTFEPLSLAGEAHPRLRLELLEIRAGSKYEDTALSEITIRGGPCH